jgi:phage terminase large subunit
VQETVDTGYRPRAPFVPFHQRSARFACIVAHRRAGKTVACIADLVDAALRTERKDGRFAYLAPLFNQAKDVAWAYLKEYAGPILSSPPNETELRVDLVNGSRIRLYGADNPDRLRGLYLDGIILDEYADMAPSVWGSVLRPALADRQGWAVFIGTPKGRNAFWEIYEYAQKHPDWYSLMLRASDTGLLPEGELKAAAEQMTPEQYAQEFECSFDAAILGAYYGREIAALEAAGQIGTIEPVPGLPVHTAWDLGIGDSTAIWLWQMAGNEVRVIDFYENSGFGLEHYAEVLKAKGHAYGQDFVPHDARVRELGTGRTRIETLIALGRKPRLVPGHKLMDRINATRITLPRVWFDAAHCADGIEALRQYRAEYDEKVRTFKDAPKHDWSSHAADAFGYMCMAWRELAQPVEKPKGKTLQDMTLNDLWEHTRPASRRI